MKTSFCIRKGQLSVGDRITGQGIPRGTRVACINGDTVTLTKAVRVPADGIVRGRVWFDWLFRARRHA